MATQNPVHIPTHAPTPSACPAKPGPASLLIVMTAEPVIPAGKKSHQAWLNEVGPRWGSCTPSLFPTQGLASLEHMLSREPAQRLSVSKCGASSIFVKNDIGSPMPVKHNEATLRFWSVNSTIHPAHTFHGKAKETTRASMARSSSKPRMSPGCQV